ncbi:MAG: CvpA family protein [Gemmataceae bacterium]
MLTALVLIFMGSAAYAGFREGVFTSFCMLVNVFLAGLLAFNFFEPMSDALEGVFKGTDLLGYEDFLCLAAVFIVALILLRILANNFANRFIDFPAKAQQFGGGAVGLLTGYCLAGFFLCTLETLPWQESFLDFPTGTEAEASLRGVWPPDRAWLSLMRFAGAYSFSAKERDPLADSRYDRFETFDRWGTFELRYQRYRRYGEGRPPFPYQGELDDALGGKR